MNYSDKILDSKIFNLIKQLIQYVAVSICIILGVCLVLVYGFGFKPYEVLSDSMAPVFTQSDMVIVKKHSEYKIGDILTFTQGNSLVTHRYIASMTDSNGNIVYICHGDNVQSANPNNDGHLADWHDDADYIATLSNSERNDTSKVRDCQYVSSSQIVGEVITHLENWGTYVNNIADHKLLLIAMVIAIWCVTETVQNEIDMKRALRLL